MSDRLFAGVEGVLVEIVGDRWLGEALGIELPEIHGWRELELADGRVVIRHGAAARSVLMVRVADLGAASAAATAAGATVGSPEQVRGGTFVIADAGAGGAVALYAADPVDPADEPEAQIQAAIEEFESAGGPPTAEVADGVAAIAADAYDRVGRLVDGVPNNKVLAAYLLLGQRHREAEPDSPEQWQLSASTTLLSRWFGRDD